MFLPYPCISPHTCCLRQVATALVSSQLDYANSVLYGSRCLKRLQRIQNSVTRIVLQQPLLSSWDTLQQLHWLPVKWQIQFKLASLAYNELHTGTPSCLSERLHPYVPSRTLRSSSSANLHIPHTNLHFGSLSFHIAAPTVWNSIPSTLRSSQTFSENILNPIFSSLHLIAPSDLSSASDLFYWMSMVLNNFFTF